MQFLTTNDIPFVFSNIYDELITISNFLKKKYYAIQTQKTSKKEQDTYYDFISQKIKKIGSNNSFLGEEAEYLEQPKCFLDGKQLFCNKLYGFVLVAYTSDSILIINPITNIHYWKVNNLYYINGSPVSSIDPEDSIDTVVDSLIFPALSNSLLMFLNKIGNIKKITCDIEDENYATLFQII